LKSKDTDIFSPQSKKNFNTKKMKNSNKDKKNKLTNKIIPLNKYSDFELNLMEYNDALFIDNRTYFQYYFSLLKTKHPIIFTFCYNKDYNSLIIKICLFSLSFAIYYLFNAIFFNYSIIHIIYKDALEIDKRTYLEYYISLLKTKHPIIFSFCPIKDNNSLIIKICLFCLSFSIYYFFNTFFFTYNIIHKVYEDKGSYNISLFMPSIIFSFIFSYIINAFIKYFSLSERNLAELKNEKMNKKLFDKKAKIQRCLIIKYLCYFNISLIFLSFFWYYLSSFCAVYQNSQVYVIKNTFISFIIGLIYPFFINLFPGIFRLYSLKNKKVKRECIYKTSQFLQFL
jgi:hypothetical protein